MYISYMSYLEVYGQHPKYVITSHNRGNIVAMRRHILVTDFVDVIETV